MDIYGHLIEGAEAAAIQDNADMTAVANVLAATGTDPACIPFVSQEDASRCADDARLCEQQSPTNRGCDDPSRQKNAANYEEHASDCDVVREDAKCPGRDLNPHSLKRPGDFKSPVSANSTTWALAMNRPWLGRCLRR